MATAVRPAARPVPRAAGRNNFELWSWYFFRVSGVLLLFLVFGHLMIVHIINNVESINYAFVAARWQTIGWRIYDWLLLILAMTHGVNGLRVVIDDYVHAPGWRVLAMSALWVFFFVFILIGTLTIATFPTMPGLQT